MNAPVTFESPILRDVEKVVGQIDWHEVVQSMAYGALFGVVMVGVGLWFMWRDLNKTTKKPSNRS